MNTVQLPPGLTYDGPLVETANGGCSGWVEYNKIKLYTNAFVILNNKKVLLGYKKRGFGQGLWNGFGGKVDAGETPLQAAVRELEEEAGIIAPLEHCGVLFFVIDGVETAFHVDIFRAEKYSGAVVETEEMRPAWFSLELGSLAPTSPMPTADDGTAGEIDLPPIPLAQMWADDVHWLPLMFSNRHFVGRADFSADNKMLKWWFAAAP